VASGDAVSNEIQANAPKIWWVQGDAGEFGTPGGWLRAFGNGLSLVPSSYKAAGAEDNASSSSTSSSSTIDADADAIRDAVRRIDQATLNGDWRAAIEWSKAATAAAESAATRNPTHRRAAAPTSTTVLTLRPASGGGDPVVITASPVNLTSFSAMFELPESMSPGVYVAPPLHACLSCSCCQHRCLLECTLPLLCMLAYCVHAAQMCVMLCAVDGARLNWLLLSL
jgi:hypothetical protein